MSAVPLNRLSLFPAAVVAASSLVLAPVVIPIATPNMLAAAVVSHTRTAIDSVEAAAASAASDVESTMAAASVSAVGLLAHTPTLLRTVSTHDLAQFVALPNAISPLESSTERVGGAGAGVGAIVASTSAAVVAPLASAAAADPAADLLAALQSAFGRIQDAFVNAPGNVVTSIGQLLAGDLRGSLQTFTNIVIEPLVLIGLSDLPNITAPLAKLAPVLAPVINALPDIAINVSVSALQLVIDVREGVADTYDGVRNGLSKGDLGAALASFVTGLATVAQKGVDDVYGQYGVISSLADAGGQLLKAIGQIGAPAATTSTAVTVTAATTNTPTVKSPAAQPTSGSVAARESGPVESGAASTAVVEKSAPAAMDGTKSGAAIATTDTDASTTTDAIASKPADGKTGAVESTSKSKLDSTSKRDDKRATSTSGGGKPGDAGSDDDTAGATTPGGATKPDGATKTGGVTKAGDATASSSSASGSAADHDQPQKGSAAAG